MKKLFASRGAMTAVVILACLLVSLCVAGYSSLSVDATYSASDVAYAKVEQSQNSSDKTTSVNTSVDKDKKELKETTTNINTETKASKNSKTTSKTAKSASADSKTAGEFTFSEDADCAACHTTEGDSMADDAMPASNHEALKCTTCHSDDKSLEKVHDGVAYGDKTPKRLKKTSVDTESCGTCHGSLEELAEQTSKSAALTDKNGTVVNPHALPENEDHESVDCASCHSMHKDKAVEDTAKKACKGCHHTDVYECNTCHD